MTEQRSASSQWGSGWCIHGVAYGPLWSCNECGPGVPGMTVTGTVSTFQTTAAPAMLHEMRVYARHAPFCDAPGPCDCGFDAVLDAYDRMAST